MDRKKIASTLFASALTLAAASGFAFNNGSAYPQQNPYGYGYPQAQTSRQQDRALRSAIKAKREEYKRLRKAGDPRAEYARRELDALNAQWKATRGEGRGNGRSRNTSVYSNAYPQNGRYGDDDGDEHGQAQQHGHGHAKNHDNDRDDD